MCCSCTYLQVAPRQHDAFLVHAIHAPCCVVVVVVAVEAVVDVADVLPPGVEVVSVSVETGLCLYSWHFRAV